MVKTYLKYSLTQVLGQITGNLSKIVVSDDGKLLYAGCNEFVIVIDLKTGDLVHKISDTNLKSKVSCLKINEENSNIAVGYENGVIVILDINNGYSQIKKFALHKSAITCMDFNTGMSLLASGSLDTTIFIWDLVGESVLYTLTGHKDNITKVMFHQIEQVDVEYDVLLSASKDNTIKIWNIQTQQCLQTLADLVHKVNDFTLVNDIFILGLFDQNLRIYKLDYNAIINDTKNTTSNIFIIKGILQRSSKAKIASIDLSHDKKVLSILSNDNSIEFFKILSNSEVKRRLIYSMKSKDDKREKLIQKEKYAQLAEKAKLLIAKDEFNYKNKFYSLFKYSHEDQHPTSSKVFCSFFINGNNKNLWKFGIGKSNNSIEVYQMCTSLINEAIYIKKNYVIHEKKIIEENLSVEKEFTVDSAGHREVLRFVKFSENSEMFLTLSNDSAKLWNFSSLNVVKSICLDKPITGCFVWEDKYIVLGSKKGDMYVLYSNSFEILQHVPNAHEGEIWNIHPMKFSYVNMSYKILTCSSDKQIKYWNLTSGSSSMITEYKKIEANDQITFCQLSPDGRLLAYSLLDNSIQIIYEDTKKFFLNLYGHKMPVLTFDISSDCTLLVSGAADKNVKIWGLDFGDCHKSFFAHQDSVTCVKFVKKTHYFFSTSKDRAIRYWDADTFDLIMEFNDFFGEIWCLDINTAGTTFIAVSADRSIKLYDLTNEQVIPDFEKEKKLDHLIEMEMEKEFDQKASKVNEVGKEINTVVPIKKSMDNIGYAEDMMDALDLCEKFKNEVYQYEIALEEYKTNYDLLKKSKGKEQRIRFYNLQKPEVPSPSVMLLGRNIFDFILMKLKSVRHSKLESTLNNIPYSYFQSLLFYLEYYIRNNIEIELNARCIIFFISLFESQMSSDKTITRLLESISKHLKKHLVATSDVLSFNVKTIDFILRTKSARIQSIEEFKKNAFAKKTSEII